MQEEHVIAVQNMQDYIEKNIKDDITLGDLSKVALFSPWYSYRLFICYTGISPSEYIRKLRLSLAANCLKNDKKQVTEVAYELGFNSLDGFSRAFYREFKVTPKAYKFKPTPITLFIPYGIKFRYLKKEKEKMEKVNNVFIQLIEKPARKVIIKRGVKANDYWTYCNEVGCDVWGTLMSMDSLCKEPVCLWLTDKYIKPNTSSYVQGVEVDCDYQGEIPQGFDIISLPKAKYLTFQGEPFNEEDYCQAINSVQQSMQKYDPSVIGFKWDNENPQIQLEPRGERGYIELKAVIKKI